MLADPAYDDARPGLVETVIDLLLGWLGQIVDALAGTGAGGLLGLLVLAVAVVVLLALAMRGLTRLRRGAAVDAPVVGLAGRTAADWEADAEAALAQGRRDEALRCRFRALVAELVAAGLVEEVPGRTTGEYRRELADGLPSAAEPFGRATELFEDAWYGARDVTDADLASFAEAAQAARARLRARRGESVEAPA